MDAAKKKRLTRILLVVVIALAVLIVAGGLFIVMAVQSTSQSERIVEGVTIAGVDVGGLSQAEAVEKLHTQWVPALPEEIKLSYGTVGADEKVPVATPDAAEEGKGPDAADTATATEKGESISLPPEELGATLQLEKAAAEAYRIGREGGLWQQIATQIRLRRYGVDAPVRCHVDETVLRSALVSLTEKVDRKPKDAVVEVEGDEVHVVPGEVGRVLDVDESQKALAEQLQNPLLKEAQLVVSTQQPAITRDMLENFETVLSSYSTPFNPGKVQRTHNLRLAISIVNKTVVRPGEEFSLNKIVGPRLTERGYRDAPIFMEGEVVPSTGGGVCQVATTIYNAALLANLKVTERHHHSRPVDYAPSGRDATVYYGQLDLKFINTLKHPLLLIGYAADARLHVKIIGKRSDKYEVELVRSGVSSIGFSIKEQPDPELEEGKKEVEKPGRSGARVTLTQVVKKDGKEISRQVLHSDGYPPQTKVVRVGTKKPEEKPEETGVEAGGVTPPAEKPGSEKPSSLQPAPAKPGPAKPTPTKPVEPGPGGGG